MYVLLDFSVCRTRGLTFIQQSQVYTQVARLFKEAPDLMEEFKAFLPDAFGHMQSVPGLLGIMPQPSGIDASGPNWDRPESPAPVVDKVAKAPNRRRKRVDKEPAAPKAAGGSRVSRVNRP